MRRSGGGLCFMKSSLKQDAPVTAATHKCMTCQASFKDVNEQKLHYKSEWHLYNIKRKSTGINPVAYDEFLRVKERLVQMINIKNSEMKENKGKNRSKAQRADNMLPLNGIRTVGKTNAEHEGHSCAWPPRSTMTSQSCDVNVCLFSGMRSASVSENIKWMERAYSFFIPDKEYVVDMELLLAYLHDKIYDKFTCIYCDKPFKSVYAVLHHMEQKQHRKLDEDSLEELREFYDFTRSYAELIPKGNHTMAVTSEADYNDEDWEDIVTTHTDSQLAIQRLACYGLMKATINEGGNLMLPNGREAVHRDVSYVYKQHLVVRGHYGSSKAPAGFKFLKKDVKKEIVRGETAKRNYLERGRYNVQFKSYKLFVPCNQIAFAT